MSTSSEGEDREERRRSNLTGRAAVLALVVCLLAISLAYPLREYLAQRGDIAATGRRSPSRRSGSPSCARSTRAGATGRTSRRRRASGCTT
jgi:hypothetical protein